MQNTDEKMMNSEARIVTGSKNKDVCETDYISVTKHVEFTSSTVWGGFRTLIHIYLINISIASLCSLCVQ